MGLMLKFAMICRSKNLCSFCSVFSVLEVMLEKPVRRTRFAKDSGTHRGLPQRCWPLAWKKEKKGVESITSHPANEKWDQNESWQAGEGYYPHLLEDEMHNTTHLLEGEMWIATHLNLMHEHVMKLLDKNFCDFFMEFARFFAIFGNLMSFLPSSFFCRGNKGVQ